MNRIVVFGGGYLGAHIANYFCKKGWSVKVLGRRSIYTNILEYRVNFFEADLNDVDSLSELISKDDVVLYAAGSLNATNLFSDILPDIQSYYTSFVNLLDLCESRRIKKFVFLSSAGTVYGNTNGFVGEDNSLVPINIYGLQKVFFENLINIKNHETNNLPYLILRVSNPYGGFQNPNKRQGIIPVLINKALNNEEFTFWGNLAAVRDFIYIDDFLEAVYRTLMINSSEIINIGSGTETSISQVIEIVEERTGKLVHIVHKDLGTITIMNNRLDINKLKKLTGYVPSSTLSDGISKMINDIMETNKRGK